MLLRSKIYVSLILSIIIPLFFSTIIFTSSIRSHTHEKLESSELPTALNEIRNQIELELATPIILSKSIAQNELVKDWIKKGETPDELNKYIRYLNRMKEDNNADHTYIVSNQSKDYITNEGFDRKIDNVGDSWFSKFLKSDKQYELSLDIDKQTQQATVFINYVIEIDGVRAGVAGMSRSGFRSCACLLKSARAFQDYVVC